MNYQKEIFNIEEILFHFEMMAENFSFSSSEYFVSILNNLIDMYDPKTFVLNKTKAKRPTIPNHFLVWNSNPVKIWVLVVYILK